MHAVGTTILCAVVTASRLLAQQPSPGSPPAARVVPPAIRAERPPVIDGRDDDPVWASATVTSEFLEFLPTEGKAPRFRTEFKVAYDDRNFYVFIRAFDPHPDSIMTALTRRDIRGPSDQLKLMIDSYNDRRLGVEFAVNPNGLKRDYPVYHDNNEVVPLDGVCDVAPQSGSLG